MAVDLEGTHAEFIGEGKSLLVVGDSSNPLSLGEFKRQVFKRRIIKLKLPLEGTVGQASTTLEHLDGLV